MNFIIIYIFLKFLNVLVFTAIALVNKKYTWRDKWIKSRHLAHTYAYIYEYKMKKKLKFIFIETFFFILNIF